LASHSWQISFIGSPQHASQRDRSHSGHCSNFTSGSSPQRWQYIIYSSSVSKSTTEIVYVSPRPYLRPIFNPNRPRDFASLGNVFLAIFQLYSLLYLVPPSHNRFSCVLDRLNEFSCHSR